MNKVVHFEIPAEDLVRAKKFYQVNFGWQMEDRPEMQYIIVHTVEVDQRQMPKVPGAINGGMMQRNPMVAAPTFSIQVDDIDTAVQKIRKTGGIIVKEKTAVGPMGFVAYFKDPEGNVLSLWQNAQPPKKE